MSLLHPLLLMLAIVAVPLAAALSAALLGRLLMYLQRLLRPVRAQGSSDARTRVPPTRPSRRVPVTDAAALLPPHWNWVVLAAAIAGFSAVIVTFPDKAELHHHLDKLRGYPSTRIALELQRDSPADRAALVRVLTPTLQIASRQIRYRVRSRSGDYTLRAEVPSHYRFHDGQMQIAAGGIIAGDRLAVLETGLQAVARFPRMSDVPERIAATLQVGQQQIPLELLPHTVELGAVELGGQAEGLATPGSRSRVPQCHLQMRGIFSTSAFPVLFLASQRGGGDKPLGTLTLAEAPPLRDKVYRVTGMAPVPGKDGRTFQELPGDAFRMYATVRLHPPGFDPARMECDTALPRRTDPALMAAAMLQLFPGLEGRVKAATVQTAGSFSPWWNRGWTAVPPRQRGEAGRERCKWENDRRLRLQIERIRAGCDNPANADDACAVLAEREKHLLTEKNGSPECM